MDDKNLRADQSIELIRQMIRDTRRRLSPGSSNLFLVWGYLLGATAIGIFFLLPVSFGIIRETWINTNPEGNLIQFAVAVLVGLAGSGYALKRQVKRDAAKTPENEQ